MTGPAKLIGVIAGCAVCSCVGIMLINGASLLNRETKVLRIASTLENAIAIEGRPYIAALEISNDSRDTARIRAISKSCGCMEITSAAGAAVELPLTINPGATLPLLLQLDTEHRRGLQSYGLSIEYQICGVARTARNTLEVPVSPAWYSSPPAIVALADETTSFEMSIYTLDVLEPFGILRTSSTDDKRIRLDSLPVDATGRATDTKHGFTKSFVVSGSIIEGTDGTDSIRDMVYVYATDVTVPVLVIPVYYPPRQLPFSVSPARLVLRRKDLAAAIERSVIIRTEEEQSPKVVRLPSGTSAELHKVKGGVWKCTLVVENNALRANELVEFEDSLGRRLTLALGVTEL